MVVWWLKFVHGCLHCMGIKHLSVLYMRWERSYSLCVTVQRDWEFSGAASFFVGSRGDRMRWHDSSPGAGRRRAQITRGPNEVARSCEHGGGESVNRCRQLDSMKELNSRVPLGGEFLRDNIRNVETKNRRSLSLLLIDCSYFTWCSM